jgi:trehalose 2-sulfotransferase
MVRTIITDDPAAPSIASMVRQLGHADAYLICATPRTGSSLLCGLLESSGVAGHPESYFRQPDERSWATRWGIVDCSGGSFTDADFVRAAVAAGRTENGVFAARIMWGTLEEVVHRLSKLHPDLFGADLELLDRVFGQTSFVYLRRDDVVSQAVSWLRAEQTNHWQDHDQFRPEQPGLVPHFDFEEIHRLVQLIGEHNTAWQEWFSSKGVTPYLVRYEDLAADPVGVTESIIDYLGLALPPRLEIHIGHRRLADALNAEWIDRYKAGTSEG